MLLAWNFIEQLKKFIENQCHVFQVQNPIANEIFCKLCELQSHTLEAQHFLFILGAVALTQMFCTFVSGGW